MPGLPTQCHASAHDCSSLNVRVERSKRRTATPELPCIPTITSFRQHSASADVWEQRASCRVYS